MHADAFFARIIHNDMVLSVKSVRNIMAAGCRGCDLIGCTATSKNCEIFMFGEFRR